MKQFILITALFSGSVLCAQQWVDCRIEISYKGNEKQIEDFREANHSRQSTTTITTYVNLTGRVKGEFLDNAFTISQDYTLGKLLGNGRVNVQQHEVEVIDCQRTTKKGEGSIGLEPSKSYCTFQYDDGGGYEVSNFSLFPEMKTDGYYEGEESTVNWGDCGTDSQRKTTLSGEAGRDLMMGLGLLQSTIVVSGDGQQSAALAQIGGILSLGIGHFEKLDKGYRLRLNKQFTDSQVQTSNHQKRTEYNRVVEVLVIPVEVPKYEAFIEVEERLGGQLDRFVPLGPAFPGTPPPNANTLLTGHTAEQGNSLGFSVKVYNKSGTLYGGEYQTTFYLEEVSHYPGYCMNYPVDLQSPDTKPDLRFNKNYSGSNFSAVEDHQAVTQMGHGDEYVVLTSYDYAAYAVLKAKVKLKGEPGLLDASCKLTGRLGIVIPTDEDHNHIADAWQMEVSSMGLDETFDEDGAPSGQRRNGDGYVLFEEYRGFFTDGECLKHASNEQVRDHHVRTDPRFKDAFVYDYDDLFQQYYCPNNPAELNWHYVSPRNLSFTRSASDPNNRWVNLNQCPYFYAKQYAIFIRKVQGVQPGNIPSIYGLAYPFDVQVLKNLGYSNSDIERELNMRMDTMLGKLMIWQDKKVEELGFNTDGGSPNPMKDFHVVEIYPQLVERAVMSANPNIRQVLFKLFMQGLVQHEIGHHIGIYHHGGDGRQKVLGVLDCVMRYGTGAEKNRIFEVRNFHYCKKSESWEEVIPDAPEDLDPQTLSPIKHETKPGHGCWEQIDVKTD